MDNMKHLHTRHLDGIKSEQVESWENTPLVGCYLLKSTLENQNARTNSGPPVILIPGGWDPKQGEFSENLVRTLLEDEGASAVYELHYCFEGQDGYDEPDSVVQDLTVMSLGEARPVFVSLCAGGVLSLESVYRVVKENTAPSISGVFSIGPGTSYLNRVGKTVVYSLTNTKFSAFSKHFVYAGHDHTIGNAKRQYTFWFTTLISKAIDDADPSEPIKGDFPVPVDVLYFQIDLVSREGRARLRRVFQSNHRSDNLPGAHGPLRNSKIADKQITGFYRKIADKEAERNPAPVESYAYVHPDDVAEAITPLLST